MNDVDYQRTKLNKDVNNKDINIDFGKTNINQEIFREVLDMSTANITFQDLFKDNIRIDCITTQKKIPEIKEVYYKKTLDEIKLFVFYNETDFRIRSKIFDEIVKLRSKYKYHFDFKVFTLDFGRDVIESGMEKII